MTASNVLGAFVKARWPYFGLVLGKWPLFMTQNAHCMQLLLIKKLADSEFEIHINAFTQYWSFVHWDLVSWISSAAYIKKQHIPTCRDVQ